MSTMFHINPCVFASPHTWTKSMNVREGPASHAVIMCVHLSVGSLQTTRSTPCLEGCSPGPSLSPRALETLSPSKRRLWLLQIFPLCLWTQFPPPLLWFGLYRPRDIWSIAITLTPWRAIIAFVGLVGRLQVYGFQVGSHIGHGKFWPRAHCTLHSYRASLCH